MMAHASNFSTRGLMQREGCELKANWATETLSKTKDTLFSSCLELASSVAVETVPVLRVIPLRSTPRVIIRIR